MGISHLAKLRNYLRKNKDSFTKSFLRLQLNMNPNTLDENLDYLIKTEKVVKEVREDDKIKYRWKR